MRRISLLCLLAALLLAMPARAATTTQILRDCTDDGVLEGHYTTAELRKARKHLPTDVAEYSDCADLLTRAIDASTAGSGSPPASTPPSGGGTSTTTGHSTSRKLSRKPTTGQGLNIPVSGAATVQDQDAVGKAIADSRGQPVDVGGKAVSPGRLVSTIVPPTTLVVVLALLAAALLAACAPQIRRVVARRRRSS